MTSGSAARRYARALYALAGEEGKVAETGSSLGELATAVAEVGAVLAPGLLDGESREKLGRRMAAAVGQDSTLGISKEEYRVFAQRSHPEDLSGDVLWLES